MRAFQLSIRRLFLAVWLAGSLAVHAVLTVEDAAVDAVGPSRFLIEAEAADPALGGDRGAVSASLALRLFNTGFFLDDDLEVEASFGLVRESDGQPMMLQTDPADSSVVAVQTFTLAARAREEVAITASLRPAEALAASSRHRVSVSVRFRGRGEEWSEPVVYHGSWRTWIHFFNTVPDDASLNVKALIGGLNFTERRILRTAAGQERFVATLDTVLHRYDLESAAQPAAAIPVTYQLRLIDTGSGVDVPLAEPTLTVTRELLARSAAPLPDPVTDSWTQTLALEPAAGAVVDPVATYAVEVTVSVAEPDGTIVASEPPVAMSAGERLLVLSGKLGFGAVETTFRQVVNDPSAGMLLVDGVYTTQLAVREGAAAAAPSRGYGDGTLLAVRYDPSTGDAVVTAGSQDLSTNDTDIAVLGGLRLVRGVIRLEVGGAFLESGGILLPAGFGVSTSQRSLRHTPALSLGEIELKPDLSLPFTKTEFFPPAGNYFYAVCDRLPLRFRTDIIVWNVEEGTLVFSQVRTGDPADPDGPTLTRHFQEEELAALRPFLSEAGSADRPSNDGFLRHITESTPVTVGVGAAGEAVLSVGLDLGGGELTTHFPEGVTIRWSEGRFRLERNVVADSSYLVAPDPVAVNYPRDCVGDCGPTSGPGQLVFRPADQRYRITADGGLQADGEVIPERLRWGTTELVSGGSPPEGGFPYAHQTSQWSEGAFHAAGSWLSGSEAAELSAERRPQGLLLSGVLADGTYERPLGVGYAEGLADYAGLNLRVGGGAKTGRSVLAGISTPDYTLKARSKYYVRAGGVTGIHEATAIQPSNIRLYDFDVTLDGFRLAFRDSLNVESKTGGSVHVPSPVDPPGFDLAFKELRFECRGQPSKMRLATEGEAKSLTYWRTDIVPLSLEFAQPLSGNCPSVTAGFLKVGVETRFPSVTPQKLHATLGFMANGNLVTRANPLSKGLDLDSRFSLPPNLELVGAGGVPWQVTVAGRAYLNNPSPGRPNPDGTALPYVPTPADFRRPEQGYLTFPATLNVPWFEDVKVQLQVSSSSAANENSAIHMTDGEGWRVDGRTFFSDAFFDADHHGFPAHLTDAAGQRMTVAEYRNPETPEFNPRARKRWLGVVDFDFPLLWEGTQRRFRSKTQTADLVVLGSVERQVQSLSPSTAEITFGVQLAIPRVNSQSLVAAVKEGVMDAVSEALSVALTGGLKEQLGNGLGGLDALLTERLGSLVTEPVQAVVDPLASAILGGGLPSAQLAALQASLKSLPDAGLSAGLERHLTAGVGAVDAALSILGTDGDRVRVGSLVRELLKRSGVPGAGDLGERVVNEALAEVLPAIEPDLNQARDVLLRARRALVQAGDASSKLAAQVRSVFVETAPALDLAAGQAIQDIQRAMTESSWELASDVQRRDRIRRLVSERVMACAMVPKFQYIVRQHVQDANEVFRAALDDVFGQVNHLVREVVKFAVKEASGELDALLAENRNPAAGEMGPTSGGSGKLAGLNIEGYAQINDESLRVLNINGKFEFNVPDALTVQAHLRIQEYDANTPPSGCRPAGVAAAVVQIDARAECEWIGAAGTVVEVGAKFSLQDGKPIGFDGYFGLEGDIRLGPIVVTQARLMAGFGGFRGLDGAVNHWAYVGAKVRGRFNAYEAGVGLFFGRTCDAAVIRMIDPDVATVLEKAVGRDSGPMTGVYFYGEAWIPINEVFGIPSTCLFTVRATAGAGFFAFIHDNGAATIGCKQKYGADGRLLCIFGISGEMRIIGALTTAGQATPTTGAGPNDGLFQRADQPDTSKGSFVLYGAGEFAAELGICPFCIELSKSVGLIWTIGGEEPGLDIEF